jgi:hypothetical protein
VRAKIQPVQVLRVSERVQLALLQLAGFAAAVASLWLAVTYGSAQPLLFGAVSNLISWYVGTKLGTPLPMVTLRALQSMPPGAALEAVRKVTQQPERVAEAVQLITRAIASMAPPPPAARVEIINNDDVNQ